MMSECCKDLFTVLDKYAHDDRQFDKNDLLVVVSFILSWNKRQCKCIFHDQEDLARLEDQLQVLLSCAVVKVDRWPKIQAPQDSGDEGSSNIWSLYEKEKLFCAVVKVFQLHFPFYQARKIHVLNKEVSSKDCAKYCDMNDGEVPEALLINVACFCDKGGLTAIRNVFQDADTTILPFHVAHLLITIVTQLRVWFSVQAIMKYIIPLRRPVIRYLCKLTDQELRQPDGRVMADTMWSAVKGPVESGPIFDSDSMDLAFKYFTSSTLTVRLAGLNQITNQVHMFVNLFQTDTITGLDNMCTDLSQWLVENKLVEHIFGPNLHVELLKQAQIILNYLAQEAYLTTQHLDCIWVAAQLKHASRYVHDLLTVLTKHMDMQSILYLLDLVSKLPPSSHTKQSLYLASVLIRIVWKAGLSPNAMQTSNVPPGSPVQGPVAQALLQRKFSHNASLSQSSSRSGSLSDISGFDGDQRDMEESPTPRKFDSDLPLQSNIRVSADALKRRVSIQDLTPQYSDAADVFTTEHKSREDAEIDSTSCTNSHGSSLSERQDLEEFDGEDMEDELKTVAALRVVQSEGAEGQKDMGFDLNSVCEEGKTLLWDLIQDHNAVYLEDGLIQEAEKFLCQLICFTGEKKIRMKFIEGCLTNVAKNRSVVMSLQLLPKLFNSFQQFLTTDQGPHWITCWANRELRMMDLLFANLVIYMKSGKAKSALYCRSNEVHGRLQFLSSLFSTDLSSTDFKLSLEQVDILWLSLVCDSESSDDALEWFLHQAQSKDLHALDAEALQYIFTEKLPSLAPETFSMTGLNLLQHLYKMFKTTSVRPCDSAKVCGIDQLWNIALQAKVADVSWAAISYLNSLYINADGGSLTYEEEFIQRCMRNIREASQQLNTNQDLSLQIMERGLLLMKSHIETFKKRFSFHLRLWGLEGKGLTCHQRKLHRSPEKLYPIRVMCQPAGLSDKGTFEMNSSDLVADLRAEVTHWCKQLRDKLTQQQQQVEGSSQHSALSAFPPQLHPPFRLISQGHELTPDLDEKSLAEVGFKDLQLVFISVGAIRRERYFNSSFIPSSALPEPYWESTPVILLLEEKYFEQLFTFLETLDKLLAANAKLNRKVVDLNLGLLQQDQEQTQEGCHDGAEVTKSTEKPTESPYNYASEDSRVHLEGRVERLCCIIWQLLRLLPTNQTLLEKLKYFGNDSETIEGTSKHGDESCSVPWNDLLQPEYPHKLLYSLQIIDLVHSASENDSGSCFSDSHVGSDDELSDGEEDSTSNVQDMLEAWGMRFVDLGGLKHLYYIFMLGHLEAKQCVPWTQWQQECLAHLLKIICEFGTMKMDSEDDEDEVFGSMQHEIQQSQIQRRDGQFRVRYKSTDKEEVICIRCLSQNMVSIIDTESLMDKLLSISYEATLPVHGSQNRLCGGDVVHHAVSLLVSCAYTDTRVSRALLQQNNFKLWLQQLVLLAKEPSVRYAACRCLFRLGLIRDNSCLTQLMDALLEFLPLAESIQSRETRDGRHTEPCAREYFDVICRLVDGLSSTEEGGKGHDVDLNSLAILLAKYIMERRPCSQSTSKKRHSSHGEDGLTGLLKLCTAVMRHDPPFKFSAAGLKHDIRSYPITLLYWLLLRRENYNARDQKSFVYKTLTALSEFCQEVFQSCLFDLPANRGDTRDLPLCRSKNARNSVYDLLLELSRGCQENFCELQKLMMKHHTAVKRRSYGWHYWPHDNGRSGCGLVGMINLGATCYMASCMQQLYMMPVARASILNARVTGERRHDPLLKELQKMFCFLMESEKKAYNPKTFCRTYTMDKQPLNTGEQKDMTEFFTDLISKLEDMSHPLKELVRILFCGEITNNVVSLDCSHVSKTREEFYSVRCTVADMKNLYESLDEVTIKDTLDGDNMYTCSQCGKKVRAEKRACFNVLPRIMCFNTMRYTFNMVTMMKEKVNTHFSFPLQLNMAPYSEEYLMGEKKDQDPEKDHDYWYDLIGVVVHTGTAEGGHYYSFIRDRSSPNDDQWFLFNDAEVKPFDPGQIEAECFGGEITTKTYDAVTEKFLDFSFEKTHSAYMLFYERKSPNQKHIPETKLININSEHSDWIWHDNMQFLHDKHIFDTTYFNFLWLLCSSIPPTLFESKEVMLSNIKLGTSFLLETLIHAKEKLLLKNWSDLLMQLYGHSTDASQWFLQSLTRDDGWLVQLFVKCPVQSIRQMFARLCLHVVQTLRSPYSPSTEEDSECDSDDETYSVVTTFVKSLLKLLELNIRSCIKNLAEFFWFIHQFATIGEKELKFLLNVNAISKMISFYQGTKSSNVLETTDDDDGVDDDDEVVPIMPEDKYHVSSLEKMITVIALLVEKSRGERYLHLSSTDLAFLTGGKDFPFFFQAIKDNINLRHTTNLILSVCRYNVALAENVISMFISSVQKLPPEQSQSFFKLLSMLTEVQGGPPGMPLFTNLTLARIWEAAEYNAALCIDWLTCMVQKNRMAHQWVLDHMSKWVEKYLISDNSPRIRNVAAYLLVALVPNSHFRQGFRSRSFSTPHKELQLSDDAVAVLHQVYNSLLNLLSRVRNYCDRVSHGTTKLVSFFAVLNYCLVSQTEKEMLTPHSADLWRLFHPLMSEPNIPVNPNKQALLSFWFHACVDCKENVAFITENPQVASNIPLNYILSNDEPEVVTFNRNVLPSYYGLLRLCCEHSRSFTLQLSTQSNMKWAFGHLTPRMNQYPQAVNELFALMSLFAGCDATDLTSDEKAAAEHFRMTTIVLYLNGLDGGASWTTLIRAFKILLQTEEDRLTVVVNQGLLTLSDAFTTLHMMYHEATACHVTGDMIEVLTILHNLLVCSLEHLHKPDVMSSIVGWSEKMEIAHKMLSLLNSYTPPDVHKCCRDVLIAMLPLYKADCVGTMIPLIYQSHNTWQTTSAPAVLGPFFPRRHSKVALSSKSIARPSVPDLNMHLHPSNLEAPKGVDEVYDSAVTQYFMPYHEFVDTLLRAAFHQDRVTETAIKCSCVLAVEAIPLHLTFFSKFWMEVYTKSAENTKYKMCIQRLCQQEEFIEFVDLVLLDERENLNVREIYSFLCCFFPRVYTKVLKNQWHNLVHTLVATVIADQPVAQSATDTELLQLARRLTADLRVMSLLFSMVPPQRSEVSDLLRPSLEELHVVCKRYQKLKQERIDARKSSAEQKGGEDCKAKAVTEGDQGPVKKRRRTTSQDESEPTKAEEKPGPSGETSCAAKPVKAREVSLALLGPRTPPDWVDTLAKTIQSAVSNVPQ